MMYDVHIPKVGMSTVEVDVMAVKVVPGQAVRANDTIVEISADKVDFEVEAGIDGTVVEVLVSEGDLAVVGQVVARIQP
jgi:pyruvate/2-oxoglutarate dehydrogenase complex dihydrolipoamide acyltransferase (E2) component